MKKSISILLLVSCVLAANVSFGNTCESKKDYSVKSDNSKEVVLVASGNEFAFKSADVYSFEPIEMTSEFDFINVNGEKETFASFTVEAVKVSMYRLPNSYG